jgi:cobalamin biosynthesis protein CobD/CbiB
VRIGADEEQMKNKLLAAGVVAATVAIGASLLASWGVVSLPAMVLVSLRWVAIGLIAAYATSRRSLTGF